MKHSDEYNVIPTDHFVQFYREDSSLIEMVGDFIGTGVKRGHGGIVIATKPHRDALAERLEFLGMDFVAAQKKGQYVALDAAETLSLFMRGKYPDERRFLDVVGGQLASIGSWFPHVRAFGEMVALLWAEGNTEGAIRLEQLWNNVRKIHCFSLLCAYPITVQEANESQFLAVCDTHSHVIPTEQGSFQEDLLRGGHQGAKAQVL